MYAHKKDLIISILFSNKKTFDRALMSYVLLIFSYNRRYYVYSTIKKYFILP